ncbi:FGGY-family carbohydrate kinase [Celerinatantimonas diazotrophica]|uniref:Xylulokinase n=1 Tax=Celerinatantimonas diazotrophica TaxID=412034 RepID=A0A4R1J943_9GAMM|nr:FGGY-family carbohydrate kinase [Celerinatantimonas diazotrophica]TCK47098.1 xylulokinase [Celerinatantimonas diazotrophica]CAG9295867.1 Xylulose kinase [Celerinatantimonas diazotrophica]
MSHYLIGIDIGTSNIKSVLFDDQYRETYVASQPNETIHLDDSESFAEQDMDRAWQKVCLTLKELVEKCGVAATDIKGIGVTGQGEGVWLIDPQGKPVRNAILWCDSRAASVVHQLEITHDKLTQITQETYNKPLPCNTTMILSWLAQHEPQTLQKAHRLLFAKDWIRYKLTGMLGLELSDSGTSLLNLDSQTLASSIFNDPELNLTDATRLMSPIHQPTDLVGTITADVAEFTGLALTTQVCAGALDVSAAALGVGAIKDNDVFTILGTTCCTGIVTSELEISQDDSNRTIPHALADHFMVLKATLSGTPNIEWCLDSISQTHDFVEIEKLISQVPAGAGGIIYHPYLVGERAPFFNENARANFFGINRNTTREHLIKAVYEGIAYTIKDALEGSPTEGRLFLAGGGTNSPAWSQIIADVTGRTVVIPQAKELSSKGAAILAGIALGMTPAHQMDDIFAIDQCYSPLPQHFELYENLFEIYKTLRDVAIPLWDLRAQILESKHLEQ